MTDPFAAPAAIPSEYPTTASLRGRLVLIRPLKQETVPNTQGAPGAMQERVTADVTVVDGLGPVPGMTRGQPNGQSFPGPEFRGMYISQEVIVKQLADALTSRGLVLGRVDTRVPGTPPGKGNAWGLIDPSEQDKATARKFLAGQMVSSAQAPQPAPVQAAPVFVQQIPPVSAPVTAVAPPQPGTNPFA